MVIFGLTGGIASGKSFVAQLFVEQGAVALDADRHAHEALADPKTRDMLIARWGDQILSESGELRRDVIARQVFAPGPEAEAERKFLEGVIHPWVRKGLDQQLDKARQQGVAAAILDVPLLHEAGWAAECTAVLFVETPDHVRQSRAAQRGWDGQELAQREVVQMPISEKRAHADAIIRGDDLESARKGVEKAWARWVEGG